MAYGTFFCTVACGNGVTEIISRGFIVDVEMNSSHSRPTTGRGDVTASVVAGYRLPAAY